MPPTFDEKFLNDFWDESDDGFDGYLSDPVSADIIKHVEDQLGFKLPNAYIKLMKTRNGGYPKRTNHRTSEPTSWAEDHIAITGMYGIGAKSNYSLCGARGSHFWIQEWGYPEIGVYFADCPSAGHDMICFDYSKCGPNGEPRVVHVDQEFDYKVTHVADNFEAFARNLVDDETFD